MATIRDIAEHANVSIATVSKVLNGKRGVNKSTASAVLSIAQELNYRPNLNARFLKIGHSKTLGVITEDLTVFNAPEIVDGISEACESFGYHYILGNLRFNKRYGNGPRDQEESALLVHNMVNDMLSKQVDGIIYIGCHGHVVVPLSEHSEPQFVCVYCTSADVSIPSVLYDDKKAAYDVTSLLIRNGAVQIGMITGPTDSIPANNRTRGHQEALFTHGMPYNPALTLAGDWTRDSGYKLGSILIQRGAQAIFAQNDLMATGVIDFCNENGIEVGRDLLLCGFDNREISTVSRPKLSTVELPLFEMGQAAGKIMFDLLHNSSIPAAAETYLDCRIIERQSSGFQAQP